jgi:hypothetical protein
MPNTFGRSNNGSGSSSSAPGHLKEWPRTRSKAPTTRCAGARNGLRARGPHSPAQRPASDGKEQPSLTVVFGIDCDLTQLFSPWCCLQLVRSMAAPGRVRRFAVCVIVPGLLVAGCADGRAASSSKTSAGVPATSVLPCPRAALPLPNYGVAPAAEAGLAAAIHQRRTPHIIVESAERAPTGPRGEGVKKYCGSTVWKRTVEVDMLQSNAPGASIAEIVVFVARFPLGYQTWYVAH